ncbi:hypothetical protein AB1Y20_010645 [Prymnesium parvum]|uniref:Mitochondrial 18 kDa protein n=1 Tax=Prymnesium parvum TaxID=97485 RepID=A0AB34IS45_PRYPA
MLAFLPALLSPAIVVHPAARSLLTMGSKEFSSCTRRAPCTLTMSSALTTTFTPVADIFADAAVWQSNHAFLSGILVAIATRLIISEIRARIEKPVMDEVGKRVKEELTPDSTQISSADWAKLAGCIALDLGGDSSELLPVLGEFTDIAYAPFEAALLKVLFKSNAIAGFGFVEEILPFTDVLPTFTLTWCLSNLFPSTPLARRLLPQPLPK